MILWIFISFSAATFQTVRFMLQKLLATVTLTPAGATFSRFFYSAPFVWLGLGLYLIGSGRAFPDLTIEFWIYALVGGLFQILGTICVVSLFKQRNFAVGITFMKTEVIQTALVGLVLLGDQINLGGWCAIFAGVVAVLILSKPPKVEGVWWQHLGSLASVIGLGSGAFLGISAVSYRAAALTLGTEDAAFRAAVTLGCVVALQVVLMLVWLVLRDRQEIIRVWQARSIAVWVGLTSLAGSFCWFWAFALQNAAYVKAVGQVELILAMAASVLFFHETISRRELWGMGLLCLSILGLILSI